MYLHYADGTLTRRGWEVTRKYLNLRKDEKPADDVIAGTCMLLQRQRCNGADERELWEQLVDCLVRLPLID